jgi:hypothetical protein
MVGRRRGIRGLSQDAGCARLFPIPNFYLSAEAAREAVNSRNQFNLIRPTSGMKVDFFVAGDDIERARELARQNRLEGLLDRVFGS